MKDQNETNLSSMDNTTLININEIKDAIKRSGYLLENRILSKFLNLRFSAESNHAVFLDQDDNKYREVDVIASNLIDSFWYSQTGTISLYIHFLVECINNPVPLGLFESFGDNDEPSTDWIYSIQNGDEEAQEMISLIVPGVINDYQNNHNSTHPSRQYCSFVKKKGEQHKDQWMAIHPDDFHKTLLKIVDTVKYKVKYSEDRWNGVQPELIRLELFVPIVVLQNDLIKIFQTSDLDNDISIEKIEFDRLKTPYDEKYNRNLSIDIVQEKYFDEYLKMKLDGLRYIFNQLKEHISNFT